MPAAWFARGTLQALVEARSYGQPARQLAMGVAMLFMLGVSAGPAAATTAPHAGMSGGSGSGASADGIALLGGVTWSVGSTTVGLLVVVGLVAAAHVRELQVAAGGPGQAAAVTRRRPGQLLLARRPGLACQLAMTVAMAYLLALMLG